MAAASACNARSPVTAKKRTLPPPQFSETRRAPSRPLRLYFFQAPAASSRLSRRLLGLSSERACLVLLFIAFRGAGAGRRHRARVKDAGAAEVVESKRKLWPASHRRLQGQRAVSVLMDSSILHFWSQQFLKQSSCERGVDSRGKP
uniref:Uncharacterized protein n=1 Tax=Arundo donax TaxID=35708 RepID=A0A0A9CWB5_ARUDO